MLCFRYVAKKRTKLQPQLHHDPLALGTDIDRVFVEGTQLKKLDDEWYESADGRRCKDVCARHVAGRRGEQQTEPLKITMPPTRANGKICYIEIPTTSRARKHSARRL